MNSTKPNPWFNFAWKLATRLNSLPRRRCTWGFIAIAVALLTATVVSLFLIHGRSPTKVFCYSKVSSNGITAYAKYDTPASPTSCALAAQKSGTTKLSSLPPGLTEVCDNGSVTVYMTRDQIQVLKNLGLSPASVCS